MIGTAFSLATLTTGGCLIIYSKLPRSVRKFIEKHSLLTDVLTLIAVYYLLGGTLTALFAASMVGLLVSALLHISAHPDRYLYLYDLKEALKKQINTLNEKLQEFGRNYREAQEVKVISK